MCGVTWQQTGLCHSPVCCCPPQLLPKPRSIAEERLQRGLLALTDAEGVEVGQPQHGLAQHGHRVQPTAVKAGALHVLQPHRGEELSQIYRAKASWLERHPSPACGGVGEQPLEAVCAQGLCSQGSQSSPVPGLTSCRVAEHSSMAM